MMLLGMLGMNGFAQDSETVTYGGTSTNTFSHLLPGWYGNHRAVVQYNPEDLGLDAGSSITAVAFRMSSINSGTTATMKIWLAEIDGNISGSSVWSNLVSNATLVYDGACNVPSTGWVTFELDEGFDYNGGNLILMTDGYGCSTSGGCSKTVYYNATDDNTAWQFCHDGSAHFSGCDNLALSAINGAMSGSKSTQHYKPDIRITYQEGSVSCHAVSNLSVSDITTNSATVTWTASEEAVDYILTYKPSNSSWESDAVVTVNNITGTTYELSNLAANTNYSVRVVSNCGSELSSARNRTFKTDCGILTLLPLVENFDTYGTSGYVAPDCWTRSNTYSTTYQYPYITTTNYSSPGSLYFYAGSTTYNIIALPEFDSSIDISDLTVSFRVYASSPNYCVLQVGVMTDPEDETTFTSVATVPVGAASTWNLKDISLASYTGTGKHIAFRYNTTSSTYSLYIDNLSVDYSPSCARPTNLSVVSATNNDVTLKWNNDTNITSWRVEYGEKNFTLGEGDSQTADDTLYTVTGLEPNKQYDFYVYAICSDETESYVSNKATVKTKCDPVMELPYVENFDSCGTGTSAFPDCWLSRKSSSSAYVYPNSSYNVTTPASLYFSTSPSYGPVYAIMPAFSGEYPISTLAMQFKYRPESTTNCRMIVGVMTNPDSVNTFVPVDTLEATSASWQNMEVNFANYEGDGQYIAFRYNREGGTSTSTGTYYACIDNLYVTLAPQCGKPDSVAIADYRSDYVTLKWAEDEEVSSWRIEYGPKGFALGEGEEELVSENPSTISGLEPSTEYDFYVYSVCADGSYSFVSEKVQCTTLCEPFSELPLVETFDSLGAASYPSCWRKINVNNSTYPSKTTTNYSSPSSLQFNSSNSTYSVAVLPELEESVNIGDLMLSFQYRIGGFSTSMEVGVMESPVDLSTFVPVATVENNATGVWDLKDITFEEYDGDGRFIALRQRGADYSYIDNVVLDYTPSCSPVKNLAVGNVSGTGAFITWENGSQGTPSSYDIEYAVEGSDEWQNASTEETHYFFDGLEPETDYVVRVYANCGDVSEPATVEFSTTLDNCDASFKNGSSTSTTIPVENYYRYSYTQQIFRSSEMNGSGDITGISFQYNYSSSMTKKNNVKMYLGHTDKSTFSSTSDWVPFSDLTLVYSGSLNCSKGWNNFTFDTPFEYNGTDNLVLVVSDSSNGYDGNSYSFNVYYLSDYRTLYNRSDDGFINPSSPSTGTRSYYRNNVIFNVECTCPPTTVTVTEVTSNSAELVWPAQEVSEWIVSYSSGPDSEWIEEVVTTPNFSLEGLEPASTYVVRVAPICAEGDTATYTIVSVTTECVDMEIPYEDNFDTYASSSLPKCWTRSGTHNTTNPYATTFSSAPSTPNALYFYASATQHSTAALPRLSDNHSMSELRTKFNYYASNITASYLIVGVMEDPEVRSSFVPVDTIIPAVASEWSEYDVSLENYEGEGRYIAFRYYGANNAYLDNLIVEVLPVCDYVKYVNVSNVTGTSALVTWDHSNVESVSNFTVEYSVAEADSWTSQTVPGSQLFCLLSGLEQQTEYDVRITANCSNGETSESRGDSFKTSCAAGGEIGIGDASSTTYYIPVNNFYNYTYSQQIYLASELNGETDITGIAFNYKHTSAVTKKSNVKLYIAHTNKTQFADNADFVPFSDLTLVYSGDLNVSTGWNNFEFDEPFHYNGTDNIVIAAVDSSAAYDGNSFVYYSHQVSENRALNYYYDSQFPDPTSLSSFSGNKSLSKNLNDVKFLGECEAATCIRPNAIVANVESYSADIVWVPGMSETSWEIEYKAANEEEWTSAGTVNETTLHLDNLNANTNYNVRLRSVCSGGEYSAWTAVTFTTECGDMSVPMTDNFDSYETTSGTIPTCWTRVSSYSNTTPAISTSYSVSTNKSLLFSANNTTFSGAALMPLVDDVDAASIRAVFSLRMSSITGANKLYVGVMDDPADTASFVTVAEVVNSVTDTWEDKIIELSDYEGEGKYIAFRYRGGGSAYMDDLTIELIPDCDKVYDLAVENVDGSSAYISWTDTHNEGASYIVEYAENGSNDYTSFTTESTYYMLGGLEQTTEYKVRVKAACADSESSWQTAVFTTKCNAGGDVELAGGTTSLGGHPVHNWYKYSFSQQIYLASELNGDAEISGISLRYRYSYSTTQKNNVKLYLGHTDKTSFANENDCVSFDDLTLVYSGNLNATQGWNNYMFDVPFSYNGTDNLVLVALDSSGAYSESDYYNFYVHAVTENRAVVYYHDTYQIDPANLTSYAGNKYKRNSVNDIKFFASCSENDICIKPNAVVTDITDNSARLVWAPVTGAQNYEVEYKWAYDTSWSSAGTTDNTYYELTSLNASKPYQARVRTICSTTGESAWTTVDFRTDCGELVPPIVENFDSYGIYNSTAGIYPIPSCWTRMGAANRPYIAGTYVSAPGALYFNSTSGSNTSTIVLGPFSEEHPLSSLFVTMKFRTSNLSMNNACMLIGAVSDPESATTFVTIDTIKATATAVWQDIEVALSNYEGEAQYLAFRFTGSSDNTAYIDDLNIVEAPSCLYPNNLVASAPTESSITLSWNERGTAENWNIQYGPAGFALGSDSAIIVEADANAFVVENLDPNTTYDFYVQSVCGSGDESEWSHVKATIKTQCLPIDELPYTENFNNYGTGTTAFPDCWTRNSTYSSTSPYCTSSYSVSSPNSLYLYSGSSNYVMAITNRIPSNYTMNELVVNFQYKSYSTSLSAARLIVGVISDPSDAATFEPIDTIEVSTTSWTGVEVLFNNYEGDAEFIAFKYNSNSNSSYLDDVVIDVAPTCLRPSSLVATGSTSTTATLAWDENGTAESWNIQYGPAGFTLGSGTVVEADANPFVVENLDPATVYDFYVQAVCDGGDTSAWAFGKATIATQCAMITTVPQTWGFESPNIGGTSSYPLPACWNRVGSSNYPYSYSTSSYSHQGSYALYFSGSNYTAILPQVDVATLPINTLQVSFYARTYSSNNVPFAVGVITDPTSSSTFQTIDTVYVGSSYQLYDVDLTNYTGSAAYVALKSLTTTSIYVDDVTLELAPDCPKPANVIVSTIETNSATISWTGSNDAGYSVKYRQYGVETWNEATTTTESITLTGLSASTIYEVEVTPICDGTVGTATVTFSTACDVVTTFPYNESFENGLGCWTAEIVNAATWAPSTSYASDGSYSLRFPYTEGAIGTLTSPIFDLTGLTSPTLKYDLLLRVYQSYYDKVGVYYRTSQSSDWNLIAEHVDNGATSTFNTFTITLPEATNSTQVMFKGYGLDALSIYLDNIVVFDSIGGTPVVVNPTVVTNNAQAVTHQSATLYGEITNAGNQAITARGFEWRLASATTATTVNATGTTTFSANLTGLTAGTEYTFRAYVTTATGNFYGDWNNFTTSTEVVEPCNAPTNITVTDFGKNSITITWDANGATKWAAQYRKQGSTAWTIGSNNITSPTYTFSGLEEATIYEYQVQAICDGTTSAWSQTGSHSTGIDSRLMNSLSLYPNPATNHVDVLVSDNDVTVSRLEVYDVYGKLLNEVEVVDNPTRIDVSSLASGVYFVKVITGEGVATKTFVKK